MIYIVNQLRDITNIPQGSIVYNGQDIALTMYSDIKSNGMQILRGKENDISVMLRKKIEYLFSNPHYRYGIVFEIFLPAISQGKDLYIIMPLYKTVETQYVIELVGFITDRYQISYTEVNCDEDLDGVVDSFVTTLFLPIMDQDVKEHLNFIHHDVVPPPYWNNHGLNNR